MIGAIVTALKDALIQLAQSINFQYVNLTVVGTQLEQQKIEFAALAEIQDEGCVCICTGSFIIPPYTLPSPPTPTGVITFGTPSRTTTTINQPFTYSGSDATGYRYKLNSGTQLTTVSPVNLTGLTPSTTYNIQVAAYNAAGTGTWASTDVMTLAESGGGGTGGGGGGGDSNFTITFSTPTITTTTIDQPFTYSGNNATGFTLTVDGILLGAVTSPIQLAGLTPDTDYVISVTPLTSAGAGVAASTTDRTLSLVPAITFGTPTFGFDNALQPFTYNGTPNTPYVGTLDTAPLGSVTSPIPLNSLVADTDYLVSVTAMDISGTWITADTVIHTPAITTVPSMAVVITSITYPSNGNALVAFTYAGNPFGVIFKATVRELVLSAGTPVVPHQFTGLLLLDDATVTSPFPISGLLSAHYYQIEVTPVNTLGAGTTTYS